MALCSRYQQGQSSPAETENRQMANNEIALQFMTSSWIRIESRSYLATKYLFANSKHMDRVSFGDRGVGGSLAIKFDRMKKFMEHARLNGLHPVIVSE
jgi:hypothetical protein